MLRKKLRSGMKLSLLSVSLLMTASCASSGLSSSGIVTAIKGESATLTEAEKAEVAAAIRETYPVVPYPTPEAIAAIRELNHPALNAWVVELAILCRQLDEECNTD